MMKAKLISAFFIFVVTFCSAQTQIAKTEILDNTDTIYVTNTDLLKSDKIPDSVFKMKNLKMLFVGGRECCFGIHDDNNPNRNTKCWRIRQVSPEIKNLTKLDSLFLTLSIFEKFPDEISSLKQLRYIDLTDNENLKSIDNLIPLSNLNELLLFGCTDLYKLPANIGKLKKLKRLGLTGTNIDSIELARIKKALPNCVILY